MSGHTYPLRDIPPELWRRAKILGATLNIPIRTMLLEGLALWLDAKDGEPKGRDSEEVKPAEPILERKP